MKRTFHLVQNVHYISMSTSSSLFFIFTQSSLFLSSISDISLSYTLSLSCSKFLSVSLPLPVAYLCLLSLCRPAVFWPQSERIVGYGWRQSTGSGSRSSRQCRPPQVRYNISTWRGSFSLSVFYSLCDNSYIQVSQHSADQHESVLSATLHQRHTEKLPQGWPWFSMPYRHRLLPGRVPFPGIRWHNLWYNQLPVWHIHSLNLLSVLSA